MDRNWNRDFLCPYNPGQARKSLWIETLMQLASATCGAGQARKSLWIETAPQGDECTCFHGQARKSLWIETLPSVPKKVTQAWSGS